MLAAEPVMKKANQVLTVLCLTTFAVTAATSMPLLILYLRNETMEIAIARDLHGWSGIAFIIIALLRILLNRKFVAGSFKQLTKVT